MTNIVRNNIAVMLIAVVVCRNAVNELVKNRGAVRMSGKINQWIVLNGSTDGQNGDWMFWHARMIVASASMVYAGCSMASIVNNFNDGVLRRCRFVVTVMIAGHSTGIGRTCNNLDTGMRDVVVFRGRIAADNMHAINDSSATLVCR